MTVFGLTSPRNACTSISAERAPVSYKSKCGQVLYAETISTACNICSVKYA